MDILENEMRHETIRLSFHFFFLCGMKALGLFMVSRGCITSGKMLMLRSHITNHFTVDDFETSKGQLACVPGPSIGICESRGATLTTVASIRKKIGPVENCRESSAG